MILNTYIKAEMIRKSIKSYKRMIEIFIDYQSNDVELRIGTILLENDSLIKSFLADIIIKYQEKVEELSKEFEEL